VTIQSGASVHPGNSPGTLTINGPFSSSGNLLFDIGGLADGQYSVLKINGDASFSGGNVEFDFINGFNPKADDYWNFLFAKTITGWHSLDFTLNGLGIGYVWKIDSIEGGENLSIKQAPAVPLPTTLWLLGSGSWAWRDGGSSGRVNQPFCLSNYGGGVNHDPAYFISGL
jgi:hypothetical protein